jgi:cytochrome c6
MRRPFSFIVGSAALLAACGSTPSPERAAVVVPGQTTFNAQCALCHGRKGDLGASGAKDLTKSTLTRDQMIAIVAHGKGGMMAYDKMFSATEIEQVVDYARSLHTAE